jgi:hypothetical protein
LYLAKHYVLIGDEEQANALFASTTDALDQFARQTGNNSELAADVAVCRALWSASSDAELADTRQKVNGLLRNLPVEGKSKGYLALASALARTGGASRAIDVLQAGLKERSFRDSYDWMIMEELLERLLREAGDAAGVEALLRDAINFRERFLTKEAPITLEAKVRLARWFLGQQRAPEAASLLPICRQLADHAESTPEHRDIAIQTAVTICEALNRPEDAAAWKSRLLE